jgi:virginiamycin B lyase
VGPDGAVWFVERPAGKIGRLTPDGTITEFPLPDPDSVPNVIVPGPDGALWFTELRADKIGRLTPEGALTEFPVPGVGPVGAAFTGNGALWVTGFTSNELVRLTTDGRITARFPIPTPESGATGLTAAPDGTLWFSQQVGHKIGRLAVEPTPPGAPVFLPQEPQRPRALPRTGAGAAEARPDAGGPGVAP